MVIDDMQTKTPSKGFTIVELLLGIAVLVILISIIIVAIRGVIESGKKSQSISNLRSLSSALHLYANDNAGRFPSGRPDAPSGGGGWGAAHRSQFWMGLITPYITGQEYDIEFYRNLSAARGFRRDFDDVFFCPIALNPHPYGSYALNPVKFPRAGDGTPEDRAMPGPLLVNIERPSQTILLLDAASTAGEWDTSWTIGIPRRLPDGTINVAFFDGRVENFDFDSFTQRIEILYNP
jgi:prepilin-type N-terminal cleavage/methylation domain-containing protein/prepilin-type processing-associated H-X9-DG protein